MEPGSGREGATSTRKGARVNRPLYGKRSFPPFYGADGMVDVKEFAMAHKSPSSSYSIPGQRPPLDPDGHTVAVPRMGDELTGSNVQGWLKDADKRKRRR